MTKELIFKVGRSAMFGSLVLKPSSLIIVTEDEFYGLLECSLSKVNDSRFRASALKKRNLKKGITVKKDFFIIE